MTKALPFLEIMKLPMNIGHAIVEGGNEGLQGGDPLMATAKRIEMAFKKPFSFLPMEQGGQPPQLPGMDQMMAFPNPTQLLMAPPPFLTAGGEIVGGDRDISGHTGVRTSIY